MNNIEGPYLAGFHDLNHIGEMIQRHSRPAIAPRTMQILGPAIFTDV
jgi:hypothetical protein